MTPEAIGDALAPVNALLNGIASGCLLAGWLKIRAGNREAHRRLMMMAVGASALFLVFYLTRFALSGTHTFAGEGLARTIYLTILFSHMVLAALVVPLVLRMLFLASQERFEEHRRLGRWTFPIWFYVSITGLVVYFMLYQIYGYLPDA